MNDEQIMAKLKRQLSQKRLTHSANVSKTAEELAKRYGADQKKAKLAGILHDCAREISTPELLQMSKAFGIVVNQVELSMPVLLHAALGAKLARREYNVEDEAVLRAITLHTTGDANMTLLDKIIYLADCIEPARKYPGVETLRILAAEDLDKALLAALDHSLNYIVSQQGLIHPATVAARNDLLISKSSLCFS